MFKNLKTPVPAVSGFLTGAVTALVLYVANHVLHVPVLQSSVETAVTPFASVAAASLVHFLSKPATKDPQPPPPPPDPFVEFLVQAATLQVMQVAANPALRAGVVRAALSESGLTKATDIPVAGRPA